MAFVIKSHIIVIILTEHLLCACHYIKLLSPHNNLARWVILLILTLQIGKLRHEEFK